MKAMQGEPLPVIPDETLLHLQGGSGEINASVSNNASGTTGTVTVSNTTGRWQSTGSLGTNGHAWDSHVEVQRNGQSGWHVGGYIDTNSQKNTSGGVVIGKRW